MIRHFRWAFQNWRAGRIRERNAKLKHAGANYARETLRTFNESDRPLIHLHNMVVSAHCLNDFNAFDEGIEEVLHEHDPARSYLEPYEHLYRTRAKD